MWKCALFGKIGQPVIKINHAKQFTDAILLIEEELGLILLLLLGVYTRELDSNLNYPQPKKSSSNSFFSIFNSKKLCK